ncbi:unnamed protein product [Closterium sp. Naga37s-1]|nr:unnamed protein product [Closterium sp. Naga37s-1]
MLRLKIYCALALIEMRVALGVTGMQWWRTNGKVVCGAWIGVECDTKGNVVSVTAYNVITVPGLLPNSFTKLKTLTYLDLSSNRLNALLDQFARPLLHLPSLRVLSLNNNKLWGSVPSYLLQKPKLQKLLLSRNFLTGTLPPKKSKTLSTLSIAHNFIRGRFPFTMSCNTVGNCLDNPGARCTSYPQRTPSRCLAQCGGAEVGASAGTAATAASAAAAAAVSTAAVTTTAGPARSPAALIAAAAAADAAAAAAARSTPRTAASASPTALKPTNTNTTAASSSSFSNPSSVYSAAPFLTPCGGYGRCLPSVDDTPGDVSASLLPATQWTCMCAAGARLKDTDVCGEWSSCMCMGGVR